MKKFIKNCILFILVMSAIFGILIFGTKKILNRGHYYSIDKNVDKLLFGHSHAANAFNDSLIKNFENFGCSGESYFYTYYKAKKLTENNPQIKTVFIVFTNNQIETHADEWIWSDKYLNHPFPKYAAFIDKKGYELLLDNNWKTLLVSECIALRENLYFLFKLKSQNNYIKMMDWSERGRLTVELDIKLNRNKKINKIANKKEISITNLNYLLKTMAILKQKKINVFLIRTPLHNDCQINNEEKFKEIILENSFSNLFFDFKDYPLKDNQFIDLSHLNVYGAKEFTSFFDNLLKDSLLQRSDKQDFINKNIEKLN